METLLKQNKLKATEPRKLILALFDHGHEILSAQDIFKKLKKFKMDIVTIYRTLGTFEKSGIIKKVDFRKDADYYELAHDDHHHHLICKGCNTVESFDMCIAPEVSKKILKKSKKFSTVSDHAFELFGYCKKCSK